MNAVKRYENTVTQCTVKIRCPVCQEILLGKHWTHHWMRHKATPSHTEVDSTQKKMTSCPWCLGSYTFSYGKKRNHLPHLTRCFSTFLQKNAVPPENLFPPLETNLNDPTEKKHSTVPVESLFPSHTTVPPQKKRKPHPTNPSTDPSLKPTRDPFCCPVCTEFCLHPPPRKQFWGRRRLETADPRFYENVLETVPEWLHQILLPPISDPWKRGKKIGLQEDPERGKVLLVLHNGNVLDHLFGGNAFGLQSVLDWIKRFYAYPKQFRWYHLIVRANAMASFADALAPYSEHVCLLPFWCLCDGKTKVSTRSERSQKDPRKFPDPLSVHHRHMILVTRLSGSKFEKAIWRHVVRATFQPERELNGKGHATFSEGVRTRASSKQSTVSPFPNEDNREILHEENWWERMCSMDDFWTEEETAETAEETGEETAETAEETAEEGFETAPPSTSWGLMATNDSSPMEKNGSGNEDPESRKWDRFKLKIRIKDIQHFCNTLCYVSLPKSKCRGNIGEALSDLSDLTEETLPSPKKQRRPGQHHYYINHPLHAHTLHVLAHLYPQGQEAFVIQSLGPRIQRLYGVVQKRYDAHRHFKHYIRPTDACPKIRNCPIPLCKNFQLQDASHDIPMERALQMDRSQLPTHYLFGKNYLMPLKRNDALLKMTTEEWLHYQVNEGGNRFMERVENDWVAVSRSQQACLNEIERVVKELKGKLETKEKALESKEKALESKEKALESKDRALESKDRQLKIKDKQLEIKDKQLEECKDKYEHLLQIRPLL